MHPRLIKIFEEQRHCFSAEFNHRQDACGEKDLLEKNHSEGEEIFPDLFKSGKNLSLYERPDLPDLQIE